MDRSLRAGAIRLDLDENRVWLAGAPLALSAKPVSVLRLLMERSCRLVTKAELFDEVWGGLAVSDSVLTTAVRTLRQALGDDARNAGLIETVHGKGYRFLLPVDRNTEAAASTAILPETATASPEPPMPDAQVVPARLQLLRPVVVALLALTVIALAILARLDRTTGTIGAAPIGHPKSVSVLPFRDDSERPGAGWFASGLTEEVTTSLTRVPDLRVASPTSALRIAGGERQLEAARALGVAHVLRGSVRRADGRVRVIAGLVRTADGTTIWSQRYDRSGRDAIAIQEDVAVAIAGALSTVLEPARLRAMVTTGTVSVEAYDAWLAGLAADKQSMDDGGIDHSRRAADAYERARTLDPGFAAAHWEAARKWYGNATRMDSQIFAEVPEPERARRFFNRLQAAIASSRDPVESLKYRAFDALMRLRPREAQRLMTRYVAARPRDIDGWEELAVIAAAAGDRAAIADAARQVHRLSIESGEPRSRAITLSVMALDLNSAVSHADEQLRLRPDSAVTQYQAHRAYLWRGQAAKARAMLAKVQASDLEPATKGLALLRQACADGDVTTARAIAARLRGADLGTRWLAAETLGETDRAAALLAPLDRPEKLPILLEFAINPNFGAAPFPQLDRTLLQNGVRLPAAVPMPARCRR